MACIISGTRRSEVTAENLALLDAIIGEKPIGCFCFCPALACERNALAHAVTHLPQELTKSSAKPNVFESCFVDFARRPVVERDGIGPVVRSGQRRRLISFPAS